MTEATGAILSGAVGPSEQEKGEQTQTSETTAGGDRPTRWVAVGINLNPGEAMVIKTRLESENIPVFVKQEAIGSFMGLTVGSLGAAQVMVPEPLVEQALSILAEVVEWEEADEAAEDDDSPD